jgi:hypothetical protein
MNNNTSPIITKVWSFCNPLRDVGVGKVDYFFPDPIIQPIVAPIIADITM